MDLFKGAIGLFKILLHIGRSTTTIRLSPARSSYLLTCFFGYSIRSKLG